MSKAVYFSLFILAIFAIHFYFDEFYFRTLRSSIHEEIGQLGLSHIIAYLIVGIPIFAGTLLLGKRKDLFRNLGLHGSFLKALGFSIICTLPMFLGFAFFYDFNLDVRLNTLLISVLAAAFFEELYFRGFLFGQIYRRTSLGFPAAAFLGALFYGLLHLYQGFDWFELALVFLITFLSALIYGWVYVAWNYNLWVPILLHLWMNSFWEIFDISGSAVGDMYANLLKLGTVVLFISATVVYRKRKGIPPETLSAGKAAANVSHR